MARGRFQVLGAVDSEIMFEPKKGWLKQLAKPFPIAAVGPSTATHTLNVPYVFLYNEIDECVYYI